MAIANLLRQAPKMADAISYNGSKMVAGVTQLFHPKHSKTLDSDCANIAV